MALDDPLASLYHSRLPLYTVDMKIEFIAWRYIIEHSCLKFLINCVASVGLVILHISP